MNLQFLVSYIWRCPLCHEEKSLSIKRRGFLFLVAVLHCDKCNSFWDKLSRKGMRLRSGPSEHMGYHDFRYWDDLFGGQIDLPAISCQRRSKSTPLAGVKMHHRDGLRMAHLV
jgi:hypothetical protein